MNEHWWDTGQWQISQKLSVQHQNYIMASYNYGENVFFLFFVFVWTDWSIMVWFNVKELSNCALSKGKAIHACMLMLHFQPFTVNTLISVHQYSKWQSQLPHARHSGLTAATPDRNITWISSYWTKTKLQIRSTSLPGIQYLRSELTVVPIFLVTTCKEIIIALCFDCGDGLMQKVSDARRDQWKFILIKVDF